MKRDISEALKKKYKGKLEEGERPVRMGVGETVVK